MVFPDVVLAVRIFLIGISLLLAVLGYITWKRREDVQEAALFAGLIVSGAIYAFGYSGELAQAATVSALFWLHIEYLGIPWIPGFWIAAACRHNGFKVPLWVFFVIPVIAFFGHFTNFHQLFYSGPATLAYHSPFWTLEIPRGPIYKLHVAYLVATFLLGAGIYLSGLRNASALHRRQALLLVASSIIPLSGFFLYLMGWSPFGLDISPLTLAFSVVLTIRAVLYAGVFDLVPLARSHVFQGMRDAVLILDTRGRLLDFNPAARVLLPMLSSQSLGKEIGELLADKPQLTQALLAQEAAQEIVLEGNLQEKYYEVRTFALLSSVRLLGQAAIIANITPQVRLREELRRQAETDPLTGIANRRRFVQALEEECRLDVHQKEFSLLLIDLDHFKSINDCYGHPVGDAVLCGVTKRLLSCLRQVDLIARFGGEEFAILLPGTGRKEAAAIAEQIRAALSAEPISAFEHMIPVTASIGLVSHGGTNSITYSKLLKEVDSRLYKAKEHGRNRVITL